MCTRKYFFPKTMFDLQVNFWGSFDPLASRFLHPCYNICNVKICSLILRSRHYYERQPIVQTIGYSTRPIRYDSHCLNQNFSLLQAPHHQFDEGLGRGLQCFFNSFYCSFTVHVPQCNTTMCNTSVIVIGLLKTT